MAHTASETAHTASETAHTASNVDWLSLTFQGCVKSIWPKFTGMIPEPLHIYSENFMKMAVTFRIATKTTTLKEENQVQMNSTA